MAAFGSPFFMLEYHHVFYSRSEGATVSSDRLGEGQYDFLHADLRAWS